MADKVSGPNVIYASTVSRLASVFVIARCILDHQKTTSLIYNWVG